MPKKKHAEQFAVKAERRVFHPYELQQMVESRFIEVANRVLAGRIELISSRTRRSVSLRPHTNDQKQWHSETPSSSPAVPVGELA